MHEPAPVVSEAIWPLRAKRFETRRGDSHSGRPTFASPTGILHLHGPARGLSRPVLHLRESRIQAWNP